VSDADPDRSSPPLVPLRRALNDVRAATALAPSRPAWAAGLRAAIATVAPLAADHFLHVGGGTWMSLAGFSGALADRGGPYRTRATTLAALTIAGAAAAALGTFAAAHHPIAIPLTFVVAVACSLARAYGIAGASVGVSVLNIYVIALGYPPTSPGESLVRAQFVVVGGVWAMLVALVLWPLRPYRPVRLAVSAAYRAVADYADDVATTSRAGGPTGPTRVRGALETARAALATVRRGRPGETRRGERLLVLGELAEQMFGHLFGLSDVVETIPEASRRPAAHAALAGTLSELAATARGLAAGIEEEEHATPVAINWRGDALRAALPPVESVGVTDDDSVTHYREAAALLDRLAEYSGVSAATVVGLNQGGPLPTLERAREVEDPVRGPPLLAPLRGVLARDSIVLHFALRVGLVTAAAVALTGALGLKRGYWVTITAVIILQPYSGATSQRALQRVLGTIVGGILTAALAAVFHDPLAILVLAFVMSGISVALLPLNYAAFSVFLTPTFVLLAEASAGDWHLAGIRILNTLLGGALAVLGSRLLWPSPEAERLPAYLAAMVRAMRRYLDQVVARFGDRGEEASRALRAARREVGLAILNADESFQRLMGEHRGAPERLAPIMTLVTYARQFTASIAALALSRHSIEAAPAETLARFAGAVGTALDDLATALEEERAPAPLAALPEPDGDQVSPLLRGRMTRVARQLKTLHDAAGRWALAKRVSPR
jgi:uncharacterized membrane protein YccC